MTLALHTPAGCPNMTVSRGTPSRRSILFLALSLFVCAGTSLGQTATVREATTPVPREGAWMNMHEEFLARTKAGNVDLLFLGDSITQGWRGVRKIWDRYYAPRNAANYGIGGDKTEHVLWRLEHGEIDGIKPKVVVLMIGTNNVRRDEPSDIAAGITAIVKTLRKKLPDTKILLLGVFPRSRTPDQARERVKAVNDRIAGLDDGKAVKYLDIAPRFLEPDGTISSEIMPDYLHLSSKGYRIWADAIEPTLWSMLEGK